MLYQYTLLIMKIQTAIVPILSIILAFFMPLAPLVATVGITIIVDTIFGIYRAKKVGEQITSRRMSKLISKMALYQTSLITVFILEKFILAAFITAFTSITIPFFITKIVACVLAFIELKSMHESFEIITGKNLWNIFRELLSRGKELKNEVKELEKKD